MKDCDPDLLISLYFNGNGLMTREDFETLSAWIKEDPENARKFIQAGFAHQFIHDSLCGNDIQKNITLELNDKDECGPFCDDLWRALIVQEETAPEVEVERPIEKVPEETIVTSQPQKTNKLSIFMAITSAAALFLFIIFVHFDPKVVTEEVAEITDSINAQWTESASAIKGTRLFNNSGPLSLRKGLVRIKFHYGAEVVVEGPAEIELDSPELMFLSYGRISADVPEQAAGFTVETPHSSIIDLGTEFGVKVDVDGSTDVHMFKGKASLIPGLKGQAGKSQLITAGKAVRVKTSGLLSDIVFEAKTFVKKINSKTNTVWRGRDINLADIVGGGDGFGTAENNIAINPLTGQTVSAKIGSSASDEEQSMLGPFKEVLQSEWIDGVFVPDGGEGPVQINHEGLSFDGFVDTSGIIHAYFQNQKDYSQDSRRRSNPNIGNKPCLYMHANLGITFDLDKIRQRFGGQVEIKSFRSLSGFRYLSGLNNKADFWVLVDGQARYEKLGAVNSGFDLGSIEIPIDPEDRYLTLATTESDDGTASDWTIFVEPVLILE